jgi:hypothetical protein
MIVLCSDASAEIVFFWRKKMCADADSGLPKEVMIAIVIRLLDVFL